MALDFYIIDHAGDGITRMSAGDLADIQPSRGALPSPNTGPFRMVRVITTRTKADVMSYLEPKTSGGARMRLYYLDTTRMSAGDLATWNAQRVIEVPESTALGWIRSK